MYDLIHLIYEFIKTGLFAIGGGLATLPYLLNMSDKYPQWFTKQQLADLIAISESTPGAIGINMSTYVGFHVNGILGSILATFSLVLPSLIIIIIISKFLEKFKENKYINSGMNGLRPAVCGLIGAAGYSLIKISVYINNEFNYLSSLIIIIFIILASIKPLKKLHPIVFITLGAILGILFKL